MLTTGRPVMIVYSDPQDQYSHRVRLVMAEKNITAQIIESSSDQLPEEISMSNPRHALPILLERDLILYDSNIIVEYLEDRFPYPPLLPGYPVSRAQCRHTIHRLQTECCDHADVLLQNRRRAGASELAEARKELRKSLLAMEVIFTEKPFFMSDEFSLADCCVLPLLWRLPLLGLKLPKTQTKALHSYMENMFTRPGFEASLSEFEREIHS